MNSPHNDFLVRYKAISSMLKKRFLRKPNAAEASAKFAELAKELEIEECPHYSAFCLLAVARCENTMGNAFEESQTLVRAARLFLESEEQNHQLLCPGFSENLNGALSCYTQAVKVYLEQNQFALAVALCIEVGNALMHLGRTGEAVPHFQKAASLQNRCPLDYINTLRLIARCKIKTGDYNGALNVLTEICLIAEEKGISESGEICGVFASVLCEAEVTKVLLLLYLKPPQQRLCPSNVKTLEKYSWDTTDEDKDAKNSSYIGEELFLLMQSLVIAHQSDDRESVRKLRWDLWRHMSPEQNDLIHQIVEKLDD